MKKLEMNEGFLRKYKAFSAATVFVSALVVPAIAYANPFITFLERFGRQIEDTTRALQVVTIPLAIIIFIVLVAFSMSNAGGNNRTKFLYAGFFVFGCVVLIAMAPGIVNWVFNHFVL